MSSQYAPLLSHFSEKFQIRDSKYRESVHEEHFIFRHKTKVSDPQNDMFGTNGQNDVQFAQPNIFLTETVQFAHVFVILGTRLSTPLIGKFVIKIFDPMLRSIFESIIQNKPIPGLDFSQNSTLNT